MRPLCISILVGSVVVACTIHTEVTGAPGDTSDPGSTSGEPGTDGAPPLMPGADASATGDAAAVFDARPTHDASSATPEAGSAPSATSCLLLASDYDQTCSVDMDCVNVGEVLMCPVNECSFCRIETISTRGAAQYMAAFSQATATIPADADTCSCPAEGRPCCVSGQCQQCAMLP
jgi:hypothetical protein